MRPSLLSSLVRGGLGVGDMRVIVVVVNMPVLGWWLLLSLAGCQCRWWGGGGCIVDAGGGVVVVVVVGWVMVAVVASSTQMVGWWSWWVASWSRSSRL